MFYLKGCGDIVLIAFDPDDINQTNCVGRWSALKIRRQALNTMIPESASAIFAPNIVSRNPYSVAE